MVPRCHSSRDSHGPPTLEQGPVTPLLEGLTWWEDLPQKSPHTAAVSSRLPLQPLPWGCPDPTQVPDHLSGRAQVGQDPQERSRLQSVVPVPPEAPEGATWEVWEAQSWGHTLASGPGHPTACPQPSEGPFIPMWTTPLAASKNFYRKPCFSPNQQSPGLEHKHSAHYLEITSPLGSGIRSKLRN